ncbi:MAG: flagellar basal body P-ring protein FlgI [Thermohalobaculum sp.]
MPPIPSTAPARPAPRPGKPLFRRVFRVLAFRALAIVLALSLATIAPPPAQAAPRIKDLVEIEGVRGNDLVGYGLVVGLAGTGDGIRNAPFTEEALVNLLERLGVNVSGESFRPKNVAAVIITATLPAFSRIGGRIDVTVSAIGDAKSLLGGTLVMTPLNAADGEIYAVAQGPIIAGGISAAGDAASEQIGVPTSGSIPNGARVEREIDFVFGAMARIRLALREPDFTTAARIEAAINAALGKPVAQMGDAGTVTLDLAAAGETPARLISMIENIAVVPASKARVVVDQRSGTIVLGADVTISRVAVAQGRLSIRVTETPIPSQPNPFAEGETLVLPRTDIDIDQGGGNRMAVVEGNVSLADLVDGLNALGVGPRDMIDILKAIKAAGALHAELLVQ